MSWKNEVHYQRILEILKDYWLDEPDELKVRVSMDFVKANGETQRKTLVWTNPNYEYTGSDKIDVVSVADMDEEYFKKQERKFWDTTNYRKRGE